MSKQSIRKCVACREVGPKEDLLRFVLSGESLQYDVSQNLPGRGAYVHCNAECLKRAGHEKLWKHALKTGKVLGVQEQLDEAVRLEKTSKDE